MPGGRPTVVTDETIRKLESAFLLGCTDLEACFAADISKSTLYAYCAANPEFSERKEALKQNPLFKARGVVLEAIENKDLSAAQELLKRKEGSKMALTGADGGPVAVTEVRRAIVHPDNPNS